MTVFGFSDLAFLAVAAGYTPTDTDAAAYITAVETADGQALEPGVRRAIDEFVIGCKADGIWTALKASCILAGARTLDGCLVPLVGAAPTSYNFVAGDYDRETGLVGDGSTKYIDSNRANNADPQDSNHNAFFCTGLPTKGRVINSGLDGVSAGANTIAKGGGASWNLRSRWLGTVGADANIGTASVNSLVGINRSSGSSYLLRSAGTNTTVTTSSLAPTSSNIFIFQGTNAYSDARLAFYSIGESLDLALLDARVTTLINAFAAAIP